MTSLKHKTISGIKWTMAASVAQRILSFGTTVVLARILSPADFGLFALAFVMIDGFGIFKSLGFDSALVRRKDVDIERACNTAFFLIPAMGMILFVILFFFAPIGAKFLNNPEVAPIIRTLAIVFVISTFGKVPQTILYRDMKFKYKTIAEISGVIVYSAVALILALNKFGVWSLVVAYILRNLTQISMEWNFSGWKPRLFRIEKIFSTQINANQTQINANNSRSSTFRKLFPYEISFEFDKSIAWDMFHFGKYVLAGGIIGFLSGNLDNIIAGKFLGVTMLGYYAISYNIANFLCDYLLGRVGFILYPAYSKIYEDADEVKRVMFRSLKYVSMLVFPFTLGVFLFAPDILRIVFGLKWLPATNILRILCFVGLFRCLNTAIWPVFLAKGQSRIDFQVSAAQAGFSLILMIPLAIKFSLIGVGVAVLLSNLVSFLISIMRIKSMAQVRISHYFKSLRMAIIASFFMVTITLLFRYLISIKIISCNFIILAILSLIVYLLVVFLMDRSIIREIKEIFYE